MPEDSGHIELRGEMIRYASHAYSDWTLLVDDVCFIDEATNQNGPFTDDCFLRFVTDRDSWYEASFYADGRDAFLAAFGALHHHSKALFDSLLFCFAQESIPILVHRVPALDPIPTAPISLLVSSIVCLGVCRLHKQN